MHSMRSRPPTACVQEQGAMTLCQRTRGSARRGVSDSYSTFDSYTPAVTPKYRPPVRSLRYHRPTAHRVSVPFHNHSMELCSTEVTANLPPLKYHRYTYLWVSDRLRQSSYLYCFAEPPDMRARSAVHHKKAGRGYWSTTGDSTPARAITIHLLPNRPCREA